MGLLGSTILFVIYQEKIRVMVVYIVYGILMGCFCCRNALENNRFVGENRNRIFPIENKPFGVVEQI